MTQQVKAVVVKPDIPCSIPTTHMLKEKERL